MGDWVWYAAVTFRVTRRLTISTMTHQSQLFDTAPEPWEVDDAAHAHVATVVLTEGPGGAFDYAVPERLVGEVQPGRRVRVPFGRSNRAVVAWCVEVGGKAHTGRPLKEVRGVVDEQPLLDDSLLELTKWLADYYLCDWGQAIECAVPSGVRKQAGTREIVLLHVPTNVAAKLTQLELPKKQAAALKVLAASSKPLTAEQLAKRAGCTTGPINELRKKKLIRGEVKRVQHSDIDELPIEREPNHALNADQQAALDAILTTMNAREHRTILMHGVTGSGKTEVYIRAIEEVVRYGRQAIVLVPEISLTPQTRQRFRSRFDNVAVLHSHLSGPERNWHWQRIARGEVQVVVGARSAIFAPVPKLGLIVLDEEHDASFKQDSTPRYHAREVARFRAQQANVPLVLGSATPALESFQAAKSGEYQLVELPKRVLDRPLPDVDALDLRIEFHDRRSRGAISRQLHQAVVEALKGGGQVILLLNRRGFSTQIQCPSCGYVVQCPNCDIALTHHRVEHKALCHYCDYEVPTPTHCPECNFEGINFRGLGTQRLEQEVRQRFPSVECLRMDSDTMRKPGSHEAALARFRTGEVKILLGTQMIAKGLDFPSVTLVGVINADSALHFPDFRAAERTFALVTQVAGRTGRGEQGGRVLVQTFSPEHDAIVAALEHDYKLFAERELPSRQEYGYPPFAQMIRIVCRGPSDVTTEQFAELIGERVEAELAAAHVDARLLGPTEAPMAKLQGKYRYHMLLTGVDLEGMREVVKKATTDLKPPDDVQWIVDVDPLDML